MNKEKFLTIEEFASAAGVAVITVRNWISAGRISAEKRQYKGFRARWYISESELKKTVLDDVKTNK